jgi:hypothetical protein
MLDARNDFSFSKNAREHIVHRAGNAIADVATV